VKAKEMLDGWLQGLGFHKEADAWHEDDDKRNAATLNPGERQDPHTIDPHISALKDSQIK
jgi:hypothetical protein